MLGRRTSRLDFLEPVLSRELDGARKSGDWGTSVDRTLSRSGGVRAGTADGLVMLKLCLGELGASLPDISESVGSSWP
jgi:hypothetical protein